MKKKNKIILNTFKHDEHKTRGAGHSRTRRVGEPEWNQQVMFGADKIAATMSRPHPSSIKSRAKELKGTENNHYRISLLTRKRLYEAGVFDITTEEKELDKIFHIKDSEKLLKEWLDSYTIAGFNESYFSPYTSLKYHTLLTVALVFNCLQDNEYDELYLHFMKNGERDFYTIYDGDNFLLKIAPLDVFEETGTSKIAFKMDNGSVDRAWMHFGRTWARLTKIKVGRHLDACLRQMRSWSTALQFIDDFRRVGWNGE